MSSSGQPSLLWRISVWLQIKEPFLLAAKDSTRRKPVSKASLRIFPGAIRKGTTAYIASVHAQN